MSCKIIIITIDEPIYTTKYTQAIVKKFKNNIIAATMLSPLREPNLTPFSSGMPLRVVKQRLDYYGLKSFLKFCFLYVTFKTLDVLHRMGLIKQSFSVSSTLDKYGIKKVRCPQNDLNNPAYIEKITKLEPDIILCNFSQLVSRKFLNIARIGCLNVHYSLLPENRGREPLFWTLLNGNTAGVTIYNMTEEVDIGDIIAQKSFSLSGIRTLHRAIKYSHEISKLLVIESLEKVIREKKIFEWGIKPEIAPTYNRWPQKEHIALFRKKGFEFI